MIKLNKAKCKILPLNRGNPRLSTQPKDEGIESSATKKDSGVLVNEKLEMSQ